MGDFCKNPKQPYEVRVPNKIRKRIAMHETKRESFFRRWKDSIPLSKVLLPKKRGSLWSRFTNRVANILQIKPSGERK